MTDQYRRLAVFVDNPGEDNFLWVLIESTDDPAVWLDLETGSEAYVDDERVGPVHTGPIEADDPDDDVTGD
jgi:hypothetical protein